MRRRVYNTRASSPTQTGTYCMKNMQMNKHKHKYTRDLHGSNAKPTYSEVPIERDSTNHKPRRYKYNTRAIKPI